MGQWDVMGGNGNFRFFPKKNYPHKKDARLGIILVGWKYVTLGVVGSKGELLDFNPKTTIERAIRSGGNFDL